MFSPSTKYGEQVKAFEGVLDVDFCICALGLFNIPVRAASSKPDIAAYATIKRL